MHIINFDRFFVYASFLSPVPPYVFFTNHPSLGMQHDGPRNACPPSGHIMASVTSSGPGAFTWSQCSAQYLPDQRDQDPDQIQNTVEASVSERIARRIDKDDHQEHDWEDVVPMPEQEVPQRHHR